MVNLKRAAAFREIACDINISSEASSQPVGRAVRARPPSGTYPYTASIAGATAKAAEGTDPTPSRNVLRSVVVVRKSFV